MQGGYNERLLIMKGKRMNVVEQAYPTTKQAKAGVPFFEIDERQTPESAESEEMPRSMDGLQVSEEEYWQTYYHDPDFVYEWNNGILEEKPMADYLSFKMYRWFLLLLEEYLRAHSIAKIIGLDIGFRLVLAKKKSIRRPDLAVILYANPVDIDDEDSTYQGIFDLCIKFLSDSKPKEVTRDTVVKKAEYCQAGGARILYSGSERQAHRILSFGQGRNVCTNPTSRRHYSI